VIELEQSVPCPERDANRQIIQKWGGPTCDIDLWGVIVMSSGLGSPFHALSEMQIGK
jgi:hypothetical protein